MGRKKPQALRDLISRNTRAALAAKRAAGVAYSAHPPLGWHVVAGNLAVNRRERNTIARAQQLAREHRYSIRQIVAFFAGSKVYASRTGGPWSRSSVGRMLKVDLAELDRASR